MTLPSAEFRRLSNELDAASDRVIDNLTEPISTNNPTVILLTAAAHTSGFLLGVADGLEHEQESQP